MELSGLRVRYVKILIALLALAICTGAAHAAGNVLTASVSSVTLTCSTVTGPGTVNVVITTATKPTANLAVGVGTLPTGISVTPTSGTLTPTNYNTGITFTVGMTAATGGATAGCVSIPASGTFRFTQGASSTPDVTITVTTNTVSTASGLVVAPSSLTFTCVKTGASSYTPGAAQQVSITSAATNGGTPFSVSSASVPSWLTLNPNAATLSSSSPATTTAITTSASLAANCGGFGAPSVNYGTIHLVNAPAPDKTIPVTLNVVAPSVLTATPTPSSGALTYVKGSGTPGYVDVAVTAPGAQIAPFFAVDTTTLPIWLNADSTSGTVPKSIRFSSNSVADTLPPGNYSATVNLNVSGYAPTPINLSLLVTNPAPKLSVKEGAIQNITWQLGQAIPTAFVTLVSTDSPISYSLTTGGMLAPVIIPSEMSGLAYNFGTPIPVTFNPTAFAAAVPGNTLTGTVTITWGPTNSTMVVTFNITVVSPGAVLTGIQPASIPTAAAGGPAATVVLTGTGFVTGTDPTVRTNVGILASANSTTMTADTNIAVSVSSSSIILTITVPATADALLPFTNGGNVILGVCNPVPGANSTCNVPTATITLTIGSGPIISAVTSASKFLQVTAPTLQSIAPYDLISIFGSNFCPPCSSNQVLQATPDPTTKVYPTTLSPDASGPTQRNLSVTFYTHGTTTSLGSASLLFATNNQINMAVPSGIGTSGNVDIVASFGYGNTATTLKTSTPFQVTAVATNPGIFTIGADGQGEGAILDQNWATISQTNPAGMRSGALGTPDSDTIQIFVTGLGIPDSNAANSSGGGSAPPADCVSPANYIGTLNGQVGTSLTSADGAIIQGGLINPTRLPPCIASTNFPTVYVGNQSVTPSYAGWVSDSIAGLYQVNLQLPPSILSSGNFVTASGSTPTAITGPVQLPVRISAGSGNSQANVFVWVAPRLKMTPPTGNALTGKIGAAWPSSSVTAAEGAGPYQYLVTSGVLPSGLSLNPTTGAISGRPDLNTVGSYLIAVTAIDSAIPPVSGTTTFTLTVGGGLKLSGPTTPVSVPSLTANTSVTTVMAAGGVGAYTYAISSVPSLSAGQLTINSATGVIGVTSTTPAGNYVITVTAQDSTSGTPLVGTFVFTMNVTLNMAVSGNGSTISEGSGGGTVTVTATSGTGTYTYAMTSPTTLPTSWAFSTSNGQITISSGAAHVTTPVVVTATDTTSGTPLTGTINFNVTVGP